MAEIQAEPKNIDGAANAKRTLSRRTLNETKKGSGKKPGR